MKKKMINVIFLNAAMVSLFGLASCGSKANTATSNVMPTNETITSEVTVSETTNSSVVESEVITSETTSEETLEEDHSVTTEVFLEEYYKIFDTAMTKDFSFDGKKVTNSTEEIHGTYDCDTNLVVYEDNTHYSLYNIKEDGLVYDYKKLAPEFKTMRDVVLNYAAYNKYVVLYATADAKCTINGNEYKIVNGNDSITLNITETGFTLIGNNSTDALSFDMTIKYGNVETTLL